MFGAAVYKKGTTNESFTLSVDLAPTILATAGIEAPKRMQGRDMGDLYLPSVVDEKPAPWRTEFWKTFIRDEDQSKYFIPMQFGVFGFPGFAEYLRVAEGRRKVFVPRPRREGLCPRRTGSPAHSKRQARERRR